MDFRPWCGSLIVTAGVIGALAGEVMPTAAPALAQPVGGAPAPIPLGGGLLGGAASYVPSIPLTPASQANLAAQSRRTGGDGTWQSQISYDHGMEFARVAPIGNQAFQGAGPGRMGNAGRGAITQGFGISRFEVSTPLWVDFYNSWEFASINEGNIPFVQYPSTRAFAASMNGSAYGSRWSVNAGGEMRAVGGISWRTAAIFCNWLNNGRARTREAFMSGAYDVSTFGWSATNPQQFTDQLTASAGAIYRLPTLDEWIASVHYDPSGNGPEQPRWWLGPARNDLGLPAGQPWAGGQTSGGRPVEFLGGGNPIAIPLGAYTNVQTPWGLLDASGGTSEWLDTYFEASDGIRFRGVDGSRWFESSILDVVDSTTGDFPNSPDFGYGIRIVMTIPTPSAGGVVLVGLLASSRRRRGS